MPYCRECGAPMDEADTFCAHCGTEVVGPDATTEQGRQHSGQPHRESESTGRSDERNRTGHETDQPRRGGGREAAAVSGDPTDEDLLHERKGGLDFATYYPTHGGWTPLLLSGLLVILSFLLVPALLLLGYGYRVARAAALGRPTPPEYGDWGGLLFDGLRVTVVFVVAWLVWFVAALVPLTAALVVFGEGAVFGLLYYVVSAFQLYVVGLLFVAFVGSDSVIGAFTDGRLRRLLGSQYMFTSFLWGLLWYLALSIMVGVTVLTIVGWLWALGYLVLSMSAFWGYVHYRAVQKGVLDPPVEDEPQADPTAGRRTGQPTR